MLQPVPPGDVLQYRAAVQVCRARPPGLQAGVQVQTQLQERQQWKLRRHQRMSLVFYHYYKQYILGFLTDAGNFNFSNTIFM